MPTTYQEDYEQATKRTKQDSIAEEQSLMQDIPLLYRGEREVF